MKKKKNLIFTGIILLALVLTSGTFAYTYPGFAALALDATISDQPMATQEPSAEQPDWNSILPDTEFDSQYLLPNAAGDDLKIDYQYPDSGEHWDKVAEVSPDDWATYVYTDLHSGFDRDLYNLQDSPASDGSIVNVTVYFRFASDPGATAEARAIINTGGSAYYGNIESQTGNTFSTRSASWANNPGTNQPWTADEINALQAGIALKSGGNNKNVYCTQVYVVVDYEYVITQGEVPGGYLYDITPHPDYTGDMLVKVYLTNTSELLKAYQYLNMKLYMANSLEAGKTPDYQILSIETGVVLFNIEGGSAGSYTVEVTGGSYRLLSDDSTQWGEGWSIAPELYCEVAQR